MGWMVTSLLGWVISLCFPLISLEFHCEATIDVIVSDCITSGINLRILISTACSLSHYWFLNGRHREPPYIHYSLLFLIFAGKPISSNFYARLLICYFYAYYIEIHLCKYKNVLYLNKIHYVYNLKLIKHFYNPLFFYL